MGFQKKTRIVMKLYVSTFVLLATGHFILADGCIECSPPANVEPNIRLKLRTTGDVNSPVSSDLQPSTHIVGGAEATPHSFPYLVFLKIYVITDVGKSTRVCGGSLISSQWVITAAHCLENADVIFVTGGAHDVRAREPTQQSKIVRESFNHPEWEPKSVSNDVALLKLESNFTLDGFVKTIRLPAWSQRNDWFWRSSVNVAGWGMTSSKDIFWKPSSLQVLKSTVITNFYCTWRYGFRKIKDYHICTDDSNQIAPYKGDGGAPLVLIDSDGLPTLIGVTSKDTENGFKKSLPSVFTRVTNYLKWISNTTGIPLRENSR